MRLFTESRLLACEVNSKSHAPWRTSNKAFEYLVLYNFNSLTKGADNRLWHQTVLMPVGLKIFLHKLVYSVISGDIQSYQSKRVKYEIVWLSLGKVTCHKAAWCRQASLSIWVQRKCEPHSQTLVEPGKGLKLLETLQDNFGRERLSESSRLWTDFEHIWGPAETSSSIIYKSPKTIGGPFI